MIRTLTEISEFLDQSLGINRFKDYTENGLQVRGREEVSRVVFALDPTLELFLAAEPGTLFVLHHGLIWGKVGRIDEFLGRRLRVLLGKEQSLYVAHLPLDSHAGFGTAAAVAAMLGLENVEPFAFENGQPLGRKGTLPKELRPDAFLAQIREVLQAPHADSVVWSEQGISTVGIVTGGGASLFSQAVAEGLDAFVTGEPRYATIFEVRECRVHFFHAGHYSTEQPGVKTWCEAFRLEFPDLEVSLWERPERL